MYRVFRLPGSHAGKIEQLQRDDLVSRQSIVVRDARPLGIEGEGSIVLVEGSKAGVARAVELLKDSAFMLEGTAAKAAYDRFRSQDEDAAAGLGLIFGP